MTRLEVCIRRKVPGKAYKETEMVVLACIVMAYSARLEVLDLDLDSSSPVFEHRHNFVNDSPYPQGLLVRLHMLCYSFTLIAAL